MSVPILWRVHWQALGAVPSGFADFTQRARARGFAMIRRAGGFAVTVETLR